MFIFYAAKKFTATATGQVIKPVTCEKCGAQFHYLLSRIAVGHASAPYEIGLDSARRRAENQAQSRLKKRLQREAELVPCPHCKWINQKLITSYRKSQYKHVSIIAMFLLICGVFIDIIIYVLNMNNQPPRPLPELSIIALTTALVVAFLLTLQFLLRLRINPNTNANGSPKVPVGTPPALLKSIDALTNAETLTPVPSDLSNLQSDARWATFRPGQLAFEPLCCQCLTIPTTRFKFPVDVDKKNLAVPLCGPCFRKLQKKWWLYNLAAIPLAILLAYLISVPFTLPRDRIMLTIGLAMFLVVLAFIINDRLLRPYRLKSADRSRNIHQIRFQNPAYTALLIRKLGQQDGLYQQ